MLRVLLLAAYACSQKLRWYALCPVVDAINHSSLVQVRGAGGADPLQQGMGRAAAFGPWLLQLVTPPPPPLNQHAPAPPPPPPPPHPPQSDVAYEYFKDSFVLSTKSAYSPGEQVRGTCGGGRRVGEGGRWRLE